MTDREICFMLGRRTKKKIEEYILRHSQEVVFWVIMNMMRSPSVMFAIGRKVDAEKDSI